MRTTLDALRSLKKYTAQLLGNEWEVRLSYQEGAFSRPFCRVEEAGPSLETGSSREGQVVQPFSLMCHPIEAASADEARLEAGRVAELLRTGFRLGVGAQDPPSGLSATVVAGTVPAATYQYAVVSTSRHRESLPSAVVAVTLPAPGGVALKWDAAPSASSYRVYRAQVGGPALRALAKVMAHAAPVKARGVTYSYGGALASGTYHYAVTALLPEGESRPVRTLAAAVTGPVGRVELAWLPTPRATGYRVYRGPTATSLTLLDEVVAAQYSDKGTRLPAGASPPTATSYLDDGSRQANGPAPPAATKGTVGMPARVPLWDWSGISLDETSTERHPSDYMRVRDFAVRVIPDPQDELRIAVAADVRMGWRRAGRLPFSSATVRDVQMDIDVGA